jgi:hypothetical protein
MAQRYQEPVPSPSAFAQQPGRCDIGVCNGPQAEISGQFGVLLRARGTSCDLTAMAALDLFHASGFAESERHFKNLKAVQSDAAELQSENDLHTSLPGE